MYLGLMNFKLQRGDHLTSGSITIQIKTADCLKKTAVNVNQQ